MDLQRGFSGCNLELKPDLKPVAKGNSNHLRDQTGARCAERPGGSELWPGNFTKDSVWFCRFAFEDLFLCLPMLSAPPVPTWLRVKAGWIQEELAASRCPEDWDRKPISNSFLMSPHGKHSYFTKCFGNFAPGWKVLLAEWGSAQAYSLNALNAQHCQGTRDSSTTFGFSHVSQAGHQECWRGGALTEASALFFIPAPFAFVTVQCILIVDPPFYNSKVCKELAACARLGVSWGCTNRPLSEPGRGFTREVPPVRAQGPASSHPVPPLAFSRPYSLEAPDCLSLGLRGFLALPALAFS